MNSDLVQELNKLNHLVYYACTQVKLLNHEIDQLNTRYERALTHELCSFRYSLRLRLATLEDAKTTILQYAQHKAVRMNEIEETLLQ